MLTVLPFAPPRSLSIALASVGPWNESGGAVRLMRPLSSRPVISSLVEAGEIWRIPSGMVTDLAVGIVSAEAQAPAMHEAPSSDILRAADTAACGSVWLSSVRIFTLLMSALAVCAALLIWSAAMLAAFS